MSVVLRNYTEGRWHEGKGAPSVLVNPTTEAQVGMASSEGVAWDRALAFARTTGGPALRELGLRRRSEMVGAMSQALHAHRDELLELSIQNGGNTRSDAKFDVDGATSTLSYYAKLGASLGDGNLLEDGATEPLGRSPRWCGRHVYAPLDGVAVFINAFNFPAWGFGEKAAAAVLAGMPVVCKPATSTALVTFRMAEILVEAQVVPEGVLNFVFGSAGDLLNHVAWQDVISFTGSSDTGHLICSHSNVLRQGTRVNVEADSLNAAVLGADVDPDSDTYELFLRDVVREMTQKAGQKCTAIRRILVPGLVRPRVLDDLKDRLAAVKVGDPSVREVGMGPLATAKQLQDIQREVQQLREVTTAVLGDGGRGDVVGVDGDTGYFVAPTLLTTEDPEVEAVHGREVFGPVATAMPYTGDANEAVRLLRLGGGSLVSSVYSDDAEFVSRVVEGAAAYLGRLNVGSAKVAEQAYTPGTVLPALNHGGPGRAGGGEELGGLRALRFYMQRCAVQGYGPWLEKLA